MDNNLQDMDQILETSEEKIFSLLEEKKYFRCRDELLKFNEVDIAEILTDVMEEYDMQRAVILFRSRTYTRLNPRKRNTNSPLLNIIG